MKPTHLSLSSLPSLLSLFLFSAFSLLPLSAAADPAAEERLARRIALVAELLGEGAAAEARAEAARLRTEAFWREGALDGLLPRPAADRAAPAADGSSSGASSLFARVVVGFYRMCIGPALGARCALEPSCSRYFLLASRKHGWLGVPMTADRFVREPVVSAPDRPWVRNADGAWRHPDPVEDHDWWFE